MQREALLAVVACAAAAVCTGAGPQAWPKGLSAAQRAEIVDAHNAWRARVGVKPLRWSGDLAADAERWAARLASRGCRLSHDSKTADGENLFWVSGVEGRERPLDPLDPGEVVDTWGEESRFYSYQRNACARGKACGHYVQMVWDETREVGCAYSVCRDLGQIWVCRYRPAWSGTRRPY